MFLSIIMELIWNIFRGCSDRNFRSISQPNVKNKRSYFAYKNNILVSLCVFFSNPQAQMQSKQADKKSKLYP